MRSTPQAASMATSIPGIIHSFSNTTKGYSANLQKLSREYYSGSHGCQSYFRYRSGSGRRSRRRTSSWNEDRSATRRGLEPLFSSLPCDFRLGRRSPNNEQ
jgi:hypothetical protein